MTDHIGQMIGFNDYVFGDAHALPSKLRRHKLFRSSSWRIAMEVLRGSFVVSSGRQYAQLCDMVIAAALVDELGIKFQRKIFKKSKALKAIREWVLPPSHTGRPNHTPGLVKGVHEFWWHMLDDAFAWRFDPSARLLANEAAIVKRFRQCGVGRATSSTTKEELAGLDSAIGDLRRAKGETSDQLAMRSLVWHLWAELHWLRYKRPRTDRGDVHESRWRSAMIAAAAKPVTSRTLYDMVLVKQVNALDTLLAMRPKKMTPRDGETRELYDEVLALYNEVHSKKLVTLHHPGESNQLSIKEE